MAADKFDLVVQKRDRKTGRVTEVNPYVLRVHQGVQYFERPKGSGNLFFGNNEPAGRYDKGRFLVGANAAEHVEWVKPLTDEDKVKQAVAAQAAENERLRAELNEIKREAKFKLEGPPPDAAPEAAPAAAPQAGKKKASSKFTQVMRKLEGAAETGD
jgi:hypothetical protein